MLQELPSMLVGPIREVLSARGVGDAALKRSKVVLREDLKIILEKEVVQKGVEMSPSQTTVGSGSMGASSVGADRALLQQMF